MAGTSEQFLKIIPEDKLVFHSPFTDFSTSFIGLENPTNNKIAFKIKTTAPKNFCIRPSAGILKSEEKTTIAVMFEPIETVRPFKLMVQYCVTACNNLDELNSTWAGIDPNDIGYHKLNVEFVEKTNFGKNTMYELAQVKLNDIADNVPEKYEIAPFSTKTTIVAAHSNSEQESDQTNSSLCKLLSIALEEKEDLVKKVASLEADKSRLIEKNASLESDNLKLNDKFAEITRIINR